MYEIQQLNPRHYKILDLSLDGLSNIDIATAVGMSKEAISLIINSPSFQHELAMRRAVRDHQSDNNAAAGHTANPALKALQEGALQAARRLVIAVSDPSPTVAIKASDSILDRVGIGKVEKQEISQRSVSINITADDAAAITETIKMLGAA